MAEEFDVVVIGAGAAGMMCAAVAGARGRRVLVVDHAAKSGEKIRISGGGRCNFTNTDTGAANFLSQNPHFAKSALGRYSPWEFVALLESHGIDWHEKAKGQLFCDQSARQVVEMLLAEMGKNGVETRLSTTVTAIEKHSTGFLVCLSGGAVRAGSVVIASGGKSIPKIGASGFGYDIARQFGLKVVDTRPGLVPLTFGGDDLVRFKGLAGVAVPVRVQCNSGVFDEDLLFTHRGLSGPAILQISSYWREGDRLSIGLLPKVNFAAFLADQRQVAGRQALHTVLARLLPKRLAQDIAAAFGFDGNMADMGKANMAALVERLENWQVTPSGSEGYRTAEVTLGGVDTDGLEARTMQARAVPGLFFIGEVVDVTGWLGGYNFQWAWASGQAAGQVV